MTPRRLLLRVAAFAAMGAAASVTGALAGAHGSTLLAALGGAALGAGATILGRTSLGTPRPAPLVEACQLPTAAAAAFALPGAHVAGLGAFVLALGLLFLPHLRGPTRTVGALAAALVAVALSPPIGLATLGVLAWQERLDRTSWTLAAAAVVLALLVVGWREPANLRGTFLFLATVELLALAFRRRLSHATLSSGGARAGFRAAAFLPSVALFGLLLGIPQKPFPAGWDAFWIPLGVGVAVAVGGALAGAALLGLILLAQSKAPVKPVAVGSLVSAGLALLVLPLPALVVLVVPVLLGFAIGLLALWRLVAMRSRPLGQAP